MIGNAFKWWFTRQQILVRERESDFFANKLEIDWEKCFVCGEGIFDSGRITNTMMGVAHCDCYEPISNAKSRMQFSAVVAVAETMIS